MGCVNDVPPRPPPDSPEPDSTPTRHLPPDRDPDAAPRQRFVDRLWSLRAMIAVALASVILGGLGGAALANVGDGADERGGPGQGRFHRGGPMVPPGAQQRRGWLDRRGQGQRGWRHDGAPGLPGQRQGTPPTPSPPKPTSTG